jgi:hypothetical protein
MKSLATPCSAQFMGVTNTNPINKKKASSLLPEPSVVSQSAGQPSIAPYTASGADLLAAYNQVAIQRSGKNSGNSPKGKVTANDLWQTVRKATEGGYKNNQR